MRALRSSGSDLGNPSFPVITMSVNLRTQTRRGQSPDLKRDPIAARVNKRRLQRNNAPSERAELRRCKQGCAAQRLDNAASHAQFVRCRTFPPHDFQITRSPSINTSRAVACGRSIQSSIAVRRLHRSRAADARQSEYLRERECLA